MNYNDSNEDVRRRKISQDIDSPESWFLISFTDLLQKMLTLAAPESPEEP